MPKKLQQAVEFLRRMLVQGPLPSQQAWEEARKAGYSKRTFDRARKVLRVQAIRSGYGGKGWWVLRLPPAKTHPSPEAVDIECSPRITHRASAQGHRRGCS
jgi:putative DNA primase/helicase